MWEVSALDRAQVQQALTTEQGRTELYKAIAPGVRGSVEAARRKLEQRDRVPIVPADVDAVVNCVLAEVFHSVLPQFEGGNLAALLHVVAWRRAHDHFTRKRTGFWGHALSLDDDQGAEREWADDALDPEQALLLKEAHAREDQDQLAYLGRFRELLSPLQWEILLLRVVHDLAPQQIAEALKRSSGSVSVHLSRIREKLGPHVNTSRRPRSGEDSDEHR